MSLDNLSLLLQKKVPRFQFDVMIDVGAYIGEAALMALQLYPDARVFCVEPAPEAHQQLVANLNAYPNAIIHRIGLSSGGGTVPMAVDKRGKGSRIVPSGRPGDIEIEVASGDDFIEANGIDHVSFLKIDTEGHDLEALLGFRRTLASSRISLIEIESGLHYGNKRHVPLEQLKGFLEPLGYFLFTFHQQRYERTPYLRRCSSVFISRNVTAEYA